MSDMSDRRDGSCCWLKEEAELNMPSVTDRGDVPAVEELVEDTGKGEHAGMSVTFEHPP